MDDGKKPPHVACVVGFGESMRFFGGQAGSWPQLVQPQKHSLPIDDRGALYSGTVECHRFLDGSRFKDSGHIDSEIIQRTVLGNYYLLHSFDARTPWVLRPMYSYLWGIHREDWTKYGPQGTADRCTAITRGPGRARFVAWETIEGPEGGAKAAPPPGGGRALGYKGIDRSRGGPRANKKRPATPVGTTPWNPRLGLKKPAPNTAATTNPK